MQVVQSSPLPNLKSQLGMNFKLGTPSCTSNKMLGFDPPFRALFHQTPRAHGLCFVVCEGNNKDNPPFWGSPPKTHTPNFCLNQKQCGPHASKPPIRSPEPVVSTPTPRDHGPPPLAIAPLAWGRSTKIWLWVKTVLEPFFILG